jgi:tRNA pseudouridine13 synthase
VKSSVPKIDQLAGMNCYCTSFRGVGGLIKQRAGDFQVSEIIDGTVINDLSFAQDEFHKYPVYKLEKRDIDSNHAILLIKKQFGIQLKVLGLKDAKANTEQYASTEKTRNIRRTVRTNNLILSLIGFSRTPLAKSSLLGNRFTIMIDDTEQSELSVFESEVRSIGNFYGLQRFGSERAVSHLAGREILKKNFRSAVELLLSYTTDYDSKMSREIREKCRDRQNYAQVLEMIPPGMDIEYQMMSAIMRGKDTIAVLREIPISIRRLFIHAYQAYIFNKCLSRALLDGEDLLRGREDDLCFEVEGPLKFGKIRKFNSVVDSESDVVPAVRLVGYSFQPGNGRFEILTKNILQDEGVTAKDFYIKEMEELSSQGGFRQAPLCCRDLTVINRSPLTISFKLPKGSYATTLLRELMKPGDPIRAGF